MPKDRHRFPQSAQYSGLARFVCRLSRQGRGLSRSRIRRGIGRSSRKGCGHGWLARRYRCSSGYCWFGSSGRLGRSRSLRLNASFPRRTRVHIRREPFRFPFLFKIRGRLVRRLTTSHDVIPRIGLRTDLTPGIRPLQIQSNRIPAVRSKIDMHGTDVFEQMLHAGLQEGAMPRGATPCPLLASYGIMPPFGDRDGTFA